MLHAPALYLGRLDKRLFPAAVRGAKGFLRFIDRFLKDHSHKSKKNQTTHLFSSFVEAKDGDGKRLLSQGELHSQAVLFTTAGQDTTAVALRAILFYLTRFPHAYRNLAHEIRSTFAPNETISVDNKLKGCTYLNACLMESMRMSPVVGSIPYRRVQAGGATFDGSYIPEGYNVGSAVYTIHHNETLFPRPFEFIPERWLVDENTTQEQVYRRTQSWIPYLIGPRACFGKSFAQTVLLLTVASPLHKYDFRVADGPEGAKGSGYPLAEPGRTNPAEYQLRAYLVSTSVGPVIQLRPRS
ncbi:cytochrome P450 [Aspergillus minisclerotigenes]|uniref:Cytochrome P450 n=1 Tax=Aspergillus minisclerotigenes TaxID=656917 RepID=A0A5N6ILA3_9EURO|nr:cytochrome P450 [Aspergillus minisclerotigenes]